MMIIISIIAFPIIEFSFPSASGGVEAIYALIDEVDGKNNILLSPMVSFLLSIFSLFYLKHTNQQLLSFSHVTNNVQL